MNEQAAGKIGEQKSGLLIDSVILFAANGLGSLLGFAFHLVVARVGGPEVYADLGALISLLIVLSVAALSLQTYMASQIAHRVFAGAPVPPYLGRMILRSVLGALPAIALLILASKHLGGFLNLMDPTGVVVVALGIAPLLVLSCFRGALQGVQRFGVLGVLRVLEPGVQIAAGLGLVALGFGATGAIGGTVCGVVAAVVVGGAILRPSHGSTESSPTKPGRSGREHMVRIVLFVGLMVLFTNLDVLLVKHAFDHDASAQYVAAANMSRILFLTAFSIGMALFPKTAVDYGQKTHGLFRRSMIYFLAVAAPFSVFCALFPRQVVELFYGTRYTAAAALLPKMLAAYMMIGASYLVGLYRLSGARPAAWAPLALAVGLQVTLVSWRPGSPQQVAVYMIGCSALLLAFSAALFLHRVDASSRSSRFG